MSEFGYGCEHCEGTVRAKRVQREAFKHTAGFVILARRTSPRRTQRARREYVEPVNCSPLCFSSFPQSLSGDPSPTHWMPARGLRA
jgi:hypothetical protein